MTDQEAGRHQVLLDFDGLLINMLPFSDQLEDTEDRSRWVRFFAHTADAKPVEEGVELVGALDRIGWRWSISTTRPHTVIDRSDEKPQRAPQLPVMREWVNVHLPGRPRWIYLRRNASDAAVAVKRGHFAATADAPSPCPAVAFVDDEFDVVDELCAGGLPGLHITDLAGLSDADLGALLAYSARTVSAPVSTLKAK